MTRLAALALALTAGLALAALPDRGIAAALAFGVLLFGVNGILLMRWGAAFLGRGPEQGGLKIRMGLLTAGKLLWLAVGSWLGIAILDLQPVPLVAGAVVALAVLTAVVLAAPHFSLSSGTDLS